jgi:hypothetical protein
MKDRPYFRCRYDIYHNADGTPHDEVCGQFQLRRPDPNNPQANTFGAITRFQYDSGAELSVMSAQLAEEYGIVNFREEALLECKVTGYDRTATPRTAWQVPLWIRFRHHRLSALNLPHLVDGIPNWEFQFLFLIVEDAAIECPLLGINDLHRFFFLSTLKDQYYFFMRFPEDPDLPRNWDEKATPKRIRRLVSSPS